MKRLTLICLLLVFWVQVVNAQDDVAALQMELVEAVPQFEVVEETVNFTNEGLTLAATLTMPVIDEAAPVVLMLPGFMSLRDELPVMNTEDGMFSRAARVFAEQGVASLRIDYRGSGESEGEWADNSFSSQISDATAALDFIETLDGVDTDAIAILGLSQGGLVGSAIAGQDERVASAVFWSPVANPESTYGGILGMENITAGLASGGEAIDITLPWGAEMSLKTGFFEDIYSVSPVAEIATYEGPLMVIVGERDNLVAPQPYYGQLFMNYHPGDEQLVVMDGDHTFDVLGVGPEVLDEVIAWSLAWIQSTL